jgi:Ser/Thr protein kinase RdoA (MazF antagonist)
MEISHYFLNELISFIEWLAAYGKMAGTLHDTQASFEFTHFNLVKMG